MISGMGAIPFEGGTAFRVWAPNAESVSAVGDFNNWDEKSHPLQPSDSGYWYGEASEAKPGHEYRFWLRNGEQTFLRVDPYAREVTNSVGNGVIHVSDFDWGEDTFQLAPVNELVIYEMHIGTFGTGEGPHVGNFDDAITHLDHVQRLGVNSIEVMPVTEFAGDRSWGYNPAHPFAVESAYGGPQAFRRFVKECHARGIGVILDVVYNHFGPSDLDLWQFDGWSENGGGGIYFYNDWRAETPWGATRPDYGRGEVRQYIRDNALYWLEEFHVDGLRMDATLYIRNVKGVQDPGCDLPDGWSLVQWISDEVRERNPRTILIAEDLQDNDWLTKSTGEGGAGYHAQWCARFVHPVRDAATNPSDEARSMDSLADAIGQSFNGDPFQRIIYSESHDEVANGSARVPHEIDSEGSANWFAQKRSTLAATLVFTSPGIPMIFQGQEFLAGGWFEDTQPLDWDRRQEFRGIVRLYRDLIGLRLNRQGVTRGLTGSNLRISYLDDSRNLLIFHRWHSGGAGDDVVVAVNFSGQWAEGIHLEMPGEGIWKLRLNSDWEGYSAEFGSAAGDMTSGADLRIAPYSALVFSQDQ